MARRAWGCLLVAALVAFTGACGDDDSDSGDSSGSGDESGGSEETTPPVEPLRILVTNDDGVGGEGIAALVAGLETLPDVEVTVVAPSEDRSGTSDSVTDPPPAGSAAALVDGHEAIAVAGFPADSVIHALDEVLDEPPHVVVSGINMGQNLGPVVWASGTVGAARTAGRRGIPALAVSHGLAETIDYQPGVELALDWVTEHRDDLLAGEVDTETIANLNVPTCSTGDVRGVVDVETSTIGDHAFDPIDCASTVTGPATDIEGFLIGYAVLADVPLEAPA